MAIGSDITQTPCQGHPGHQADLGLLGRFQGVSDTSGASGQVLATGIHIYSGRNGLI